MFHVMCNWFSCLSMTWYSLIIIFYYSWYHLRNVATIVVTSSSSRSSTRATCGPIWTSFSRNAAYCQWCTTYESTTMDGTYHRVSWLPSGIIGIPSFGTNFISWTWRTTSIQFLESYGDTCFRTSRSRTRFCCPMQHQGCHSSIQSQQLMGGSLLAHFLIWAWALVPTTSRDTVVSLSNTIATFTSTTSPSSTST